LYIYKEKAFSINHNISEIKRVSSVQGLRANILQTMDKEVYEINAWRDYFESTGADIFKIIKWSITVASCYHSDDFFQRRDAIAGILYAKTNQNQNQPRIITVASGWHSDNFLQRRETIAGIPYAKTNQNQSRPRSHDASGAFVEEG